MLKPEQESALISAWIETKDQKYLVQLIKAFEPLVLKHARLYSSYGIDREELVAVGNLALVETAGLFDPSRGFKFSTYAGHWIRGMMLIFIASNYFSFTLKSQKLKHIFFTLRKQIHAEQKNGMNQDTEQMMAKLAEHYGCPAAQLEQIYYMIRQPHTSLSDPIRGQAQEPGEEGTLGDMLATEEPDPEQLLIRKSLTKAHRELVHSTMGRVLNERERTIIEGQLLTDEDHERTLQDLADEFQLSRERVRQIRNNAYEKLERAIRNKCSRGERRSLF